MVFEEVAVTEKLARQLLDSDESKRRGIQEQSGGAALDLGNEQAADDETGMRTLKISGGRDLVANAKILVKNLEADILVEKE